jgi:hypothetical protein
MKMSYAFCALFCDRPRRGKTRELAGMWEDSVDPEAFSCAFRPEPEVARKLAMPARIAIAVACAVGALPASLALQSYGIGSRFFPFYAAVVAAIGWGGAVGGSLAYVLELAEVDFFFLPALYAFGISSVELPGLLAFATALALIGVIAYHGLNRQRRARLSALSVRPLARQSRAAPSAPSGHVLVARRNGFVGEPRLSLPEWLTRDELRGAADDFLAVEIEGTAMAPVLKSGDRTLADRRRTVPIQEDLFAIDEGMGAVVKWIEPVPGSNPLRVRVRSEGEAFSRYEMPVSGLKIIGRVVWVGHRF